MNAGALRGDDELDAHRGRRIARESQKEEPLSPLAGGELQGLAFLIELSFLKGQAKLQGEKVFSVLQY